MRNNCVWGLQNFDLEYMQVLDYREILRDMREGEERMVVSGGIERYLEPA
jgi:hypothetical protein